MTTSIDQTIETTQAHAHEGEADHGAKRCSRCQTMKPASTFYRDTSKPDGRQSRCRECQTEAQREARKGHRGILADRPRGKRWEIDERLGALVVEAIGRSDHERPQTVLEFACDCGNTRTVLASNVRFMQSADCGDRRHHPIVKPTTYDAMHGYLKQWYGPAQEHDCAHCGQRPGEGWAYLHRREAPLFDADGKNAGLPWSDVPSDYAPLCSSCHKRYDNSRHRKTNGATELGLFLSLAIWSDEPGGEFTDEPEPTSTLMFYRQPAGGDQ